MSSYDFINDEAQGANRVSGRLNRRRLEEAGGADYDDNRTATFGADDDFLREPAPAERQQSFSGMPDPEAEPPIRRAPPQAFLASNRAPMQAFPDVAQANLHTRRRPPAPAGAPPKKRGFFRKLWSAVRGRGRR